MSETWRDKAARLKVSNEADEQEAKRIEQEQDAAAARRKQRQDFGKQWEFATSPLEDIESELRRQHYEKLERSIIATDGADIAKVVIRWLIGFDTTARRADLIISSVCDGTLTETNLQKQFEKHFEKQSKELKIAREIPDIRERDKATKHAKKKVSTLAKKTASKQAKEMAICLKQATDVIPRKSVNDERRRLLRELGQTISDNGWTLLVDQLPDNGARNVLTGLCGGDITDDELDELLLTNRQTWFQFRDLKDAMLSRIKSTEERIEVVVAGPSFFHAELAEKLSVDEATLVRWAKRVNANRPKTGQRDFRYSPNDVKKICEHGLTARFKESKDAAKRLLAELESPN